MMSFFVMCSWYEEWRVYVMGGEILGGAGGELLGGCGRETIRGVWEGNY